MSDDKDRLFWYSPTLRKEEEEFNKVFSKDKGTPISTRRIRGKDFTHMTATGTKSEHKDSILVAVAKRGEIECDSGNS